MKKGHLILDFENVGDGLYLADELPDGQKVDKGRIGGLQIFQCEKKVEYMKAYVQGGKVVIEGKEIQSHMPTRVKIAKTGWYQINLYNNAGIPARLAEIYYVDKF